MVDVNGMLINGLQIMGIGVGIVFIALGIFFLITKLLMKIWPAK